MKIYAILLTFLFAAISCSKKDEKHTGAEEVTHPLAAEVSAIDEEISQGSYGYIDHFLVIHRGDTLIDKSYSQDYSQIMYDYDTTDHQYNYDHPDWHPFYQGTRLHTLQSVTKSITSLLMGVAVDEGLLDDLSNPALQYFTDYASENPEGLQASMSVNNLLTMQAGILWDETNYSRADNHCILMEESDDWIGFVLSQPMDTIPGKKFVYNSGASVLLGKIVREATGNRIDNWAEEKLFGPLGITDYYWKITPKGEVDTEGGLYLSSHDLAKIGMMVMQGGRYEGKQVISREWIDVSTFPHVNFDENSGYGYQWWVPSIDTRIIAGNGYGGQFLFIVPEHELLVVFNGWNIHGQAEKQSYDVTTQRLLPLL